MLEALKLAADAQEAARNSIANAEAEIENADRDLVEVKHSYLRYRISERLLVFSISC